MTYLWLRSILKKIIFLQGLRGVSLEGIVEEGKKKEQMAVSKYGKRERKRERKKETA